MAFKNAYKLLIGFFPVVSEGGVVDPAILDEKYSNLEFSSTSVITMDTNITAYNREGTAAATRDVNLVTDMDMWTRRETTMLTPGNITLSTERNVDETSPFATLLANTSVANPLLGVFKVGLFDSADQTTRTYKTLLTQVAYLTQCDAFQGTAKEVVTSDWQFTSTGKPTEGTVANDQILTLTTGTGAIAWSTDQN